MNASLEIENNCRYAQLSFVYLVLVNKLCWMLHQHNSEREKSPVDWTLQITRDVLGDKEQRTIERARAKKWTLNVQRKQHFARITIFHVRAHNGNVMNFLISISTIYLSIFFMSTVSVLLASWCRQHRARICWRTCYGLYEAPSWPLHSTFFMLSMTSEQNVFQMSNLHIISRFLHQKLSERSPGKKFRSYREYWKER